MGGWIFYLEALHHQVLVVLEEVGAGPVQDFHHFAGELERGAFKGEHACVGGWVGGWMREDWVEVE